MRRLGILEISVLLNVEMTGDYRFGNGFVYEHLLVSLPGRYQYGWHSDVHHPDDPHDRD